jgi:hypothetical protein
VSLAAVVLSIAVGLQPVLASEARVVASGEQARSEAPQKRQLTGKAAPLTRTMASVLWNLTVTLDLNAVVAARIFPIVSEFHQASQHLERERENIVRDIRAQLSSSRPDRETLQVLADCLLANHQLQSSLAEQQFSALRTYLTPTQQAKYLLLVPRLTYLHSTESVQGVMAKP